MEDSALEQLARIQEAPAEATISLVYSFLGEVAEAGKHFARHDGFERLSLKQLNKAINSAEQAKTALAGKNAARSSFHLRKTLAHLVPYLSEFNNIDECVESRLLTLMTVTALTLCDLETKLSRGYNPEQISYEGLSQAREIYQAVRNSAKNQKFA